MIYIVDTHTQCTSSDKLIRPADFNAGHLSLLLYAVTTRKNVCATLGDYCNYCEKRRIAKSDYYYFIFFYSEKKNRNYDSTSNSAEFTRQLGQLLANGSR